MNGLNSSDSDGNIVSYLWQQTSGPTVSLNSTTTVNVVFAAPSVETSIELTFSLTVTDNDGAQDTASTTVTIIPDNSTSSVTVSWQAPATRENGSALPADKLETFQVKYTNTLTNVSVIKSVEGGQLSTQINDIPVGAYVFQVAVKDTDGLMSDYSDVVSVTLN